MIKTVIFTYLTVCPLLFSAYFPENFEHPKFLFTLTASTLLLYPALRAFDIYNALHRALTVLFAACVASTCFSIDQRISIIGNQLSSFGLLTLGSFFILFLAIQSEFKTTTDRAKLLYAPMLASLIAGQYALFQIAGYDHFNWNNTLTPYGVIRPFGTFGHPNFLAGFVVMLVPALFAMHRLLGLFGIIILLIAQSRAAWLALALQGVFFFWQNKRTRYLVDLGIFALVICGCISIVVAGVSAEFVPSLLDRIQSMSHLDDAHQEYWKTGLQIFKHYPILGSGLDTFQQAFLNARSEFYWAIEPNGSPFRAHNELIQFAATTGLIGLLALANFIYVIMCQIRLKFIFSTKQEKQLVLVLSLGIIGYGVQNLISFSTISTGALFMTQLALATSSNEILNPLTQSKKSYWLQYGLISSCVALLIFIPINFIIPNVRASIISRQARILLAHDPSAALALFIQVTDIVPTDAAAYADVGFAYERIRTLTDNQTVKLAPELRLQIMSGAIQAFAQAVARAPASALYHYKLGLAYLVRGIRDDQKSAHNEIVDANQIEPNNPQFKALLATLEKY